MTSIDNLDDLPRGRRMIVLEFYKMRVQRPKDKKQALIRDVATKLGYKIDQNNSSSHVMTVIREWEHS